LSRNQKGKKKKGPGLVAKSRLGGKKKNEEKKGSLVLPMATKKKKNVASPKARSEKEKMSIL